mmetsp:Transcript_60260/g.67367  ORF Transcript_60260/g.67367 Transcript_60260/m.67367 type:complete len:101 (+) Transcript_60260:244-546(+)
MSAVRITQHHFSTSTNTKKKSTTETIYASNTSTTCSLGGGEWRTGRPVYVNKSVYTNNRRNSSRTSSSNCTNNTMHAPKLFVGGIGLGESHTISDIEQVS